MQTEQQQLLAVFNGAHRGTDQQNIRQHIQLENIAKQISDNGGRKAFAKNINSHLQDLLLASRLESAKKVEKMTTIFKLIRS